ncbi:hypothetical protein [Herbiconiux ginsengi]|uniref:Uncharacterized protein n=1 Tax=Herbiconiux ginsengi TaxID=381665 RepID=A0A1H3MI05_9MICO|nr:hypothetical protein [Herbiconiux ginsengi]SDY76256.1 hypothetical protein SAMN05216554_1432 [Herbiconiux ginsengi]
MTIVLVFLGILALVGVAAAVRAVARDGYRRMPRRTAADRDPEERFTAH